MTEDVAGESRRSAGSLPTVEVGASGRVPGAPERRLDFDVVIATRNRPEALALSIPLILGQSRQPEKLIVIDSSDDHAAVAQAVAEATSGWGGDVIIEQTEPGLTRQRNRGLAHVEAEIVIFPDDDSLFHPGTSEAIMRAYELDTEARVAGVCARPALEPPPGALSGAGYEMTRTHVTESRMSRYANRLERRVASISPAMWLGELLTARFDRPDWLAAENCVLVEYMTGFRMSFRTTVIRAEGFDEALAAYAVGEDRDASFSAMRHGCLVGARDARIYHHKFPGSRSDAYALGIMQVLNHVYVVLKQAHDANLTPGEERKLRRLVRQFARLKVLNCLRRVHRRSGRERLRGALAAHQGVKAMLNAPRADLPRIYREAEARILARRSR